MKKKINKKRLGELVIITTCLIILSYLCLCVVDVNSNQTKGGTRKRWNIIYTSAKSIK